MGGAIMREIEGVADEPRTRRRWFHDEYFDLFVWQTVDGEVTLFQLCYGSGAVERALVWQREGGFFHDGVDPRQSQSGGGAPAPILERFEDAARSLPADIRRAVGEKIRDYLKAGRPAAARRRSFRRAEWQKRPPAP
jgi:hypothetical protein